jgi:hypothetical protein
MQFLIKLQGFKHLRTTEFTIAADPSDTITAITTKIEKITGIYGDKVSVMTGVIHGNLSGSFKKLDKNVTVSDHGLRSGSTLMVFVPVGQDDAAPPPQDTRHKVCVGKAEYRASASGPMKTGDIMAVVGETDRRKMTILVFEGVEYANAQEWLTKAFQNSGKSCCAQFEKPQAVSTPRPTRYMPPSKDNQFGRYV